MLKTIIALSAAAVCAALTGCSPKEPSVSEPSGITTLSNKLAEATSKLAQREAALDTMRVKSDLQSEEVRALTNRVVSLRRELASAIEGQRKLQERVQQISAEVESAGARQRAAEVTAQDTEMSLSSCRAQMDALSRSLESVQTEHKHAVLRVNLLEAERAALMRQWNDTAQLRAQLRSLQRPAHSLGGALFPSSRRTFTPNSDGTISAVPADRKSGESLQR